MVTRPQDAGTPVVGRPTGRNLTGRALILGAVVVLVALVLAAPLQRYLRQRDSLAQAHRQRAGLTAQLSSLQQARANWSDPSYIEQQARARLQFARPGDTVYVVVDGSRKPGDASADQARPATANAGQTTWQTKAWTSLQVADAAP